MRAVVIGKGVKNVGNSAFENFCELETAEIGIDVEIIGDYAFKESGLSEIDLSQSVTAIGDSAFENCGSLSSVKLSPSIASIDFNAFRGTALTEITVPNADAALAPRCFGLNQIMIYGYDGSTAQQYAGEYSKCTFISIGGMTGDCWWRFDDETNTLTIGGNGAMGDYPVEMAPWIPFIMNDNDPWHLYFEGNVTYIGDCAFVLLPIEGNVALPASCTAIGPNAFQSCDKITDISLENVKTIGVRAFTECSSLMTVNFSAAQTIGDNAFSNCGDLNNVMFGDDLVIIDDSAFENCDNLTSLNIPKSVQKIGNGAFNDCGSLTDLSFAEGSELEIIGSSAFKRCDIRALAIPDSVISIGSEAFRLNQNLETLTLGKALKTIGDDAFYAAKISEVTIHGAVYSIGTHALGYCLVKNGAAAHIGAVDSLDIYGLTGSAAEEYAATEDNFHFRANDVNEGRTGDCTWYYDDTNYTLSIYGSGSMADYNNPDDAPWYGKNITEVIIGENVDYIGKDAFNDIMGVFVPETVIEIADGAIGFDFNEKPIPGYKLYGYADTAAEDYADKYDHIRFKDVTPKTGDCGTESYNNMEWWYDDDSLTLFIAPVDDDTPALTDDYDFTANAPWSSVGKIAPRAYLGDKIKFVEIADGVTKIGTYAFAYLSKLISVDLPASVSSIGEGAFYGTDVSVIKVYDPECTIGVIALGYGDDPETGTSYHPFDAMIRGLQGLYR